MSSDNQSLNVDVKSKELDNQRLMVKTEPKVITKPNKEHKQDVKPNIKFEQDVKKPDLLSSRFNYVEKRSKLNDKITYEEEKVALILGTTAVFTVWWMFK